MPSTTSSWVSRLLASSTVMTPSFPTFSIASAIKSPMVRSPLADTMPTWAISALLLVDVESVFSSSTTAVTARSTPRLRLIGSWPAATSFAPSVKRARASTVAVVVPSPATSEVFEATSFTICAPMFSNLSGSSISFATVTPSLVTVGAPHDFSSTTLRPRGPRGTVTASASTLTPRRTLARPSPPHVTRCSPIHRLPLAPARGPSRVPGSRMSPARRRRAVPPAAGRKNKIARPAVNTPRERPGCPLQPAAPCLPRGHKIQTKGGTTAYAGQTDPEVVGDRHAAVVLPRRVRPGPRSRRPLRGRLPAPRRGGVRRRLVALGGGAHQAREARRAVRPTRRRPVQRRRLPGGHDPHHLRRAQVRAGGEGEWPPLQRGPLRPLRAEPDRTRRARSGEGHRALRERRARGHRTAASGFRLPQGPDPDREPREQEGGLTPPAGRSGQQSDRPAEARARPFAARSPSR